MHSFHFTSRIFAFLGAVTTPTRAALNTAVSVPCILARNFEVGTKMRNKVTGKRWIETVNKIAYRAAVADE